MVSFRCSSHLVPLNVGVMGLAIAIGLMGLAPVSRASEGQKLPVMPYLSIEHLSIDRDRLEQGSVTASLVVSQAQSVDRTRRLVLELPLHGQSQPEDMMRQAESLVQQTLAQQFQSSLGQTTGSSVQTVERVQLMVLGNRNGTVLPLVSVTVSRAQWQQHPQAKAWLQYYASQSLLHPPAQPLTVAIAPSDARFTGQPSGVGRGGAIGTSLTRTATIHQAFDNGQLTGTAAQDYLNDLD